MKNYLIIICLLLSGSVLAQTPKFGHVNLEELVHLTSARDSAVVKYQKAMADMQEIYDEIQTEYRVKLNEFQQRSAGWTAAILEVKQRELVEMQQRLEAYGESAGQELQVLQNSLFAPVFTQANEAIQKLAKELGLIYVFNSAGVIYIDEAQSINLMDRAKEALKVPAEKVSPTIIEP
ncbi:MAG: OmpH family outer membrane protein [Bacteroidales bacterium]|nr:OmpH family outer membrane protein [Bacteroidales bacterium]